MNKRYSSRLTLERRMILAVTAVLLVAGQVMAAGGSTTDSYTTGGDSPVTLEDVSGSTVKRITLSARAAERLGIETASVTEEQIIRTQIVGGVVTRPPEGRLGSDQDRKWIRIALSPGEWDRLARDRPARLLPLVVGGRLAEEILAEPSGLEPVEDRKSAMLLLYYTAPRDSGLQPDDRMRVELELSGGERIEKVVPYSAIYYDSRGDAWVYVNTENLVFQRQVVTIDSIVGDLVVLTEGPPLGTTVVTVGAALLYGTEVFGK